MGDPPASGLARALDQLARERHAGAWALVVEAAGHDCWRCCLAVCGGEADAADALQETFMQVRDDAHQFKPTTADADGDARRWLKRIAITTALQLRRRQARRRRRDTAAPQPQPHIPDPHAVLVAAEDLSALRDALASLPEPRRSAIALHHLEGLPLAEVARALDRPEGTVKTWVHRGLRDLHAALIRRGVAIPAAGLLVLLGNARIQAGGATLPMATAPRLAELLHAPGTATIHALALGPGSLSMTVKATIILAGICLAATLSWTAAQEDAPPPPAPAPAAVTAQPTIDQAAGRGMAWLATRQRADGSWSGANSVGITALATLALLSGGSAPDRGPYGDQAARGRDYLLAHHRADDGLILPPGTRIGVMNHHGMATWCLAELAADGTDARLQSALDAAVKLIIACQSREGGWRYVPAPGDADLPSTANQLHALACARRVGVAVPERTLDAAAAYLDHCDGGAGFAYVASQGNHRNGTTWDGDGRTTWDAMACSALLCADRADGDRFLRAMDHLAAIDWARWTGARRCSSRFHAALALVQERDAGPRQREAWETCFTAMAAELVRDQREDGSWDGDHDPDVLGPDDGIYTVATSVLILTAPQQRLLAMGRQPR